MLDAEMEQETQREGSAALPVPQNLLCDSFPPLSPRSPARWQPGLLLLRSQS